MKILFATYPMAFHTPGGGEIQILKYKEYLNKRGVEVDFFDLWNPKFKNYDIFHFFSCISGSNHICNFVKRLGIPVVISSSLWLTDENKNNYPISEIRSHLLLGNKIITNSKSESRSLSHVLDIDIDLFSHVYNGVDDLFSDDVDQNLFKDKYNIKYPFILNVGNIEPRKNQLVLAEAAQKLNLKLILVGHIRDNVYAQKIFSLFPTVKYVNYIPHDELLVSAYKACEVFCLPSTLETPGLAALEAAAAGAKLVLTAEGSTEEYFGSYAKYVNPNSVESIVDAIAIKLQDTKEQLFDSANYSWEKNIDKLVSEYKGLLHNSNM